MTNPLIPPGSLKLRASCDGCASSKVKCDKEQPSCRRCVASGASCVYGISRKHGKQVHRKRVSAEGHGGQALASHAHDQHRPNSLSPFDNQMQCEGLTGHLPHISNDETDFYSLLSSQAAAEWSPWIESGPMFGFDSIKRASAARDSIYHYEDTMMNSSEDTLPHLNGASVSSEASSSLATPEPFSSIGLASTTLDFGDLTNAHENHRCYSIASDALKLLNLETRFGCAKRQAEGSGCTLPPLTIAHILEANKAALHILHTILDCPCSEEDAPLAFLTASIVSKINHWYKVGNKIIKSATEYMSLLDQSSLEGCSVPNTVSPVQSQQATAFIMASLTTLPFSLGSFDIDVEDRAVLSRQLLISELRKTARLVERLQQKATDSSDRMMSDTYSLNDVGSVSSLYGLLSRWLKDEVARTTHEIRNEENGQCS